MEEQVANLAEATPSQETLNMAGVEGLGEVAPRVAGVLYLAQVAAEVVELTLLAQAVHGVHMR